MVRHLLRAAADYRRAGRRGAAFECALQAWELIAEYADGARKRMQAIRARAFPATRAGDSGQLQQEQDGESEERDEVERDHDQPTAVGGESHGRTLSGCEATG